MKSGHYIVTLEVAVGALESLAERIGETWGLPVIQLERPGHDRGWLELYVEEPDQAEIIRTVMAGWPEIMATQIRRETPRDWQVFWRHHFHATLIGRHLRIVPLWEKESAPEMPERKTIWLDPGLSFGTGDHFTTRFCLDRIDHWTPGGRVRSMLDVGTGSSILAIAARLLGAEHVVGLDHDAIALEQARENIRLNGLEGQIELTVSDILAEPPKGSFDLVCANVYTTVLLQIAPALARCTGRYLALSGIRDPELETVSAAYTALGLMEVFRDGDGEWGGLAFERMEITA
ncbi:MAG TPA: 50S ribosomal protein L11 methyltransferase [Kiritimatiellia bacterium]|mgnify:CR=1 FL=1|nr:50S ribosomal protein L11 methyltransferase [Kiritimatiellia bacterium]HMO97695.1 50S ribosomal protein L11 methyltransferase [Kiritimatiellia bacterium]HMP95555.1 50S ribosomal protein L11 methyltransferase [Kiritimatiellia bacterium]